MSIGEIARRAGLQASAIRYYETAGVLPKPRRVNGRRVYDRSVLAWLSLISLAQGAGFTISEIRTLIHGFGKRTPPSKRWNALASRKLKEIREQVRQAKRMELVLKRLLKCHCPTLQDCGRAVTGCSGTSD